MITVRETLTGNSLSKALLGKRRQIETLRSKASQLSGKDRIIFKMYLDGNLSVNEIGKLVGMHGTNVHRRICKIKKRLLFADFITHSNICANIGFTDKALVVDYFVKGLSLSRISAKRNCTLYHTRKVINKIQEKIENRLQQNGGENEPARHNPNYKC